MVVDVVESVLGDVADDQVRVLPDLTALVRLGLANEELDERRLARTVGSENGDTRRERNLQRDVVELLDGRGGVLEADLALRESQLSYLQKDSERTILTIDFSLVLTPSSKGGFGSLNWYSSAGESS